MPAVTIRLRWPNGQETHTYSPSTTIYEHLEAGTSYPMAEFLRRATAFGLELSALGELVERAPGALPDEPFVSFV